VSAQPNRKQQRLARQLAKSEGVAYQAALTKIREIPGPQSPSPVGSIPRTTLFDQIERTNASPAGYNEDSFSFLNRVAGPYWQGVRTALDKWYAVFPDASTDLWKRFRKADPKQHYAAWWELYLHHLFTNLGFRVTPNAELPQGNSRPDLLVERGNRFFYVEAVTVFSGIASSETHTALEPRILDIINTIDASNYFVSVSFTQSSTAMPKAADITTPIEKWMAEHDPDDILKLQASDLPTTTIATGDWVFELKLIPRSPEFRSKPDNRLIGTHGATAGFTNDRRQIYRALERKKKQHKAPDGPTVIALMAINGFVDDTEFTDALFGSQSVRMDIATGATTVIRNPDGLWVGQRGAASKKVSAVLSGVSVLPTNCATTPLRLWHHFKPDRELTIELPFATARLVDDQLVLADAARQPHDMLGLTADWPGPDRPFPR
jgi:hypothetical protein